MTEKSIDVIGVGNAIVDVIATVDDEFIEANDLVKGAMTLIDDDRAHELYAAMPPAMEVSGGSAANTIAGVASFGASGSYIGKVRDDQLGEVFAHDIASIGVGYAAPAATEGPATARCLIQVTPDAERTMNTYLGVSAFLEPDDVDADLVASAKLVYCEGYLWDMESAKAAIRKAMDAGRDAGATVGLTLSDGFCVDRHRAEWLDLLDDKVDLVFGNEDEVCSLFETDDLDVALTKVADLCETAAITLGAQGSLILRGGERLEIAAVDPGQVVDTTGAGDLYASGVLVGLARGLDLAECGRLGSVAAAEVISHVGARPLVDLRTL